MWDERGEKSLIRREIPKEVENREIRKIAMPHYILDVENRQEVGNSKEGAGTGRKRYWNRRFQFSNSRSTFVTFI